MVLGTGKFQQRAMHLVGSGPGMTDTQIRAVVDAIDDRWTVDRHDSADGGTALMLTPPTARDVEAVYYIDSDRGYLNLSIMERDDLRKLGRFDEVDALFLTIKQRHESWLDDGKRHSRRLPFSRAT